ISLPNSITIPRAHAWRMQPRETMYSPDLDQARTRRLRSLTGAPFSGPDSRSAALTSLMQQPHSMPRARRRDNQWNCGNKYGYCRRNNQMRRRRDSSPYTVAASTPVSKTNHPNSTNDQERFNKKEKAGNGSQRHYNAYKLRRLGSSERSYYRHRRWEEDEGYGNLMEFAGKSAHIPFA